MPMAQKKRAARTPYSVHSGVMMVQKWISELSSKAGRSLDPWMELVRTSGPASEKERREWLETEYGLGTNSAQDRRTGRWPRH